MVYILILLNITLTMIFMFMSHPLSMGLILLAQVTLIAMITGMMSLNFWFSYILFMVMIGGMLVLFMYMTSVASNEKFKFTFSIIILAILMIFALFLLTMLDKFFSYQNLSSNDNQMFNMNKPFQFSLSKYLNFPSNLIMIMLIMYLLITLIAVVKITSIIYGPLRQKF